MNKGIPPHYDYARCVDAVGAGEPVERAQIKRARPFAVIGEPKYAVNFNHYDYVNPAAPKGGNVTLSATGTFDNFNRFALRAATQRMPNPSMTRCSSPRRQAGSYYPTVAENAVRYAEDFSWAKSRLIHGRVFTMVRQLAPATWRSPFINL